MVTECNVDLEWFIFCITFRMNTFNEAINGGYLRPTRPTLNPGVYDYNKWMCMAQNFAIWDLPKAATFPVLVLTSEYPSEKSLKVFECPRSTYLLSKLGAAYISNYKNVNEISWLSHMLNVIPIFILFTRSFNLSIYRVI